MAIDTLNKEALRAVQFFEDKLNFEFGPVGLYMHIKENKPLQIIDLRTRELYEKGHVPGAQHILYDDLEKHFSKLSKEIPTVVYCYDLLCSLSTKAALLLARNGFNAKELAGGFDEYQKKDFPVESKTSTESKTNPGTSSCSTSKGSSCG